MTPALATRLNNPFDAYEVELMTMMVQAQAESAEWAARAQSELINSEIALHSYVEHMAALARTRAYGNALYFYRKHKARYAEGLLPQQKGLTEGSSSTQ